VLKRLANIDEVDKHAQILARWEDRK
jgi:hypothetical protein